MILSNQYQNNVVSNVKEMLLNNKISIYNGFNIIKDKTYLFSSGKYNFNDYDKYCDKCDLKNNVKTFIRFLGWVGEGNVLRAFGMPGK